MREEAGEALRRSETQLRLMLEAVEMTVWDWDVTNDVVELDEVGQRMLDFDGPRVSPAQESFLSRVVEDDRGRVGEAVRDAIRSGVPYAQQFRIAPRGEVRTLRFALEPNMHHGSIEARILIDNVHFAEACRAVENLTLMNDTIFTTEVYEACGTITAGPNFGIIAPGDVTMRAGHRVSFADGFLVGGGATLRVEIGPPVN